MGRELQSLDSSPDSPSPWGLPPCDAFIFLGSYYFCLLGKRIVRLKVLVPPQRLGECLAKLTLKCSLGQIYTDHYFLGDFVLVVVKGSLRKCGGDLGHRDREELLEATG